MTTSNQIALKEAREKERANRAQEKQKRDELSETKLKNKREHWRGVQKNFTDAVKTGASLLNHKYWYNEDPALVDSVAKISFNNPLGYSFQNEMGKQTVPGIMTLGFIPTIGLNDQSDVTNNVADIAAKNIYAYVRHANSGSRNYEAADLLMYILTIDQVYSLYCALTRVYSLALTSKAENKYYLKAMVQACGFDYDDVIANLPQLRVLINTMAVRLNSFYVPKDIYLFERHSWLNTSIFKDSNIKKSQEYMFIQQRYYYYNWEEGKLSLNFPSDSGLNFDFFNSDTLRTVTDVTKLANFMISQLTTIEDIGIMSGDILKAYGESNLFFVPSIPENYHIESIYDDEVLQQISNATICKLSGLEQFDITQSDGYIKQGKLFYGKEPDDTFLGIFVNMDFGASNWDNSTVDQCFNTNQIMLDFYKDDVTPDEVMVTTRLKSRIRMGYESTSKTTPWYVISSCGTEVVSGAIIYSMSPNDGSITKSPVLTTLCNFSSLFPTTYNLDSIITLAKLSNFNYHPAFYMAVNLNPDENEGTKLPFQRIHDNSNYTTIGASTLANIHYCAVLSEFGVPKLGMKVRSRS